MGTTIGISTHIGNQSRSPYWSRLIKYWTNLVGACLLTEPNGDALTTEDDKYLIQE